MRKLLVPVAFWASLLILGMSGCKLYRASDQPDQTSELERLRAENARLQAERAGGGGKPAVSAPATMSEGAQKRLRDKGITVSKDGSKIKMTLPNTILFSSGSAALRSDSKKALDEAAKVIRQEFATSDLIVQGHTDNQPIVHSANKFKSNHELSVARAKAVAGALQKEGIKNRMKVDGLGETRPLNDNKTAEDRAKNRRVEVLIAAPGTSPAAAEPVELDTGS